MVCVAPALLVGSLAFAPTLGHRAVSLRCGSALNIVAAVEPPGLSDELKPRFDRGDSETKKSFAADKPKQSVSQPTAPSTAVSNERLLAEIRALQPEPKGPRPEITKIDLNGISPAFLLFGALCYGAVGFLGVKFTVAAADYFGAHPMDDDTWWLHLYVMLSRATTVDNQLIIRDPCLEFLSRGPPADLAARRRTFSARADMRREEAEKLAGELGLARFLH